MKKEKQDSQKIQKQKSQKKKNNLQNSSIEQINLIFKQKPVSPSKNKQTSNTNHLNSLNKRQKFKISCNSSKNSSLIMAPLIQTKTKVPLCQNQFSDLSVSNSNSLKNSRSRSFSVEKISKNDQIETFKFREKFGISHTRQFQINENHTFGQNSISKKLKCPEYSPSFDKSANKAIHKVPINLRGSTTSSKCESVKRFSKFEKKIEQQIILGPKINFASERENAYNFSNSKIFKDDSEKMYFETNLINNQRNSIIKSEKLIDESVDYSQNINKPQKVDNLNKMTPNDNKKSETQNEDFFISVENKSKFFPPTENRNSQGYKNSLLRINLKQTQQDNQFLKSEIGEYQSVIRDLENKNAQIEKIVDEKDQEVYFLRGKYKDNVKLECLQGEKLKKTQKTLIDIKTEGQEKDKILINLLNENNLLQQEVQFYSESVEAEIQNLHLQNEKEKMLKDIMKKKLKEAIENIVEKEKEKNVACKKIEIYENEFEVLKNKIEELTKEKNGYAERLNHQQKELKNITIENLKLQEFMNFGKNKLGNLAEKDQKNDEMCEILQINLKEAKIKCNQFENEILMLKNDIEVSTKQNLIKIDFQQKEFETIIKKPFLLEKCCQTNGKDRIHTFNIGVDCNLEIERQKMVISQNYLPDFLKDEKIENYDDLFRILKHQLENSLKSNNIETEKAKASNSKLEMINELNIKLNTKIEDFSSVILNLKSTFELKDKNYNKIIMSQKLEIEKLKSKLEKLSTEFAKAKNVSNCSSLLEIFESKRLKTEPNVWQNNKNYKNLNDFNYGTILETRPSVSNLDSVSKRHKSYKTSCNNLAYTKRFNQLKTSQVDFPVLNEQNLSKKKSEFNAKIIDSVSGIEKINSTTQVSVIEDKNQEKGSKHPAGFSQAHDFLSQDKSIGVTENGFHVKLNQMNDLISNSINKIKEKPKINKFLFETLNPNETIETFKRFLSKINSSCFLVDEIKKSGELLQLINSIYG